MATQVQNRRGTTAEHSTFTGAVGEVTIDTDKDTAVVHDGTTAGGRPLLREDQSNLPTSAPTRGIYNASGSLALSTNGTGRLFVDASGNVGFGVSSPERPIHLPDGGVLLLGTTAATGTQIAHSASSNLTINNKEAGAQIFYTSDTERLRITSAGLVGIGTSSPSTKLSVIGAATGLANGAIRTNTTGGTQSANSGLWLCGNQATTHYNWLIASQYNVGGALEITPSTAVDGATFTTPTAVFTQTGRVGIGTTSPGALFDLAANNDGATGTTANNTFRFTDLDTNTAADQPIGKIEWYSADTSSPGARAVSYILSAAAGANSGGDIRFGVSANAGSASEAARIDSSGRLLVGTSSSSRLVTQILQGNSTSATTQAVLFFARGSASPAINQSLGAIEFGDSNHDAAASVVARRDTGTWTPGASHPGRLEFSTTADAASSPTEQLRITSDRYVRLASGTGGIQFNGDTASANALDDYEEGTWTPALAGSTTAGTYETTFASGWYTKIGRQVTVQFRINLAGSITGGGVGFAIITGLPFNTSTDNYANGGSVILGSVDFNDNAKHFYLYKRSTTSGQLVISEIFDNAAPQDVGITDFAASSIIAGSVVYFIP